MKSTMRLTAVLVSLAGLAAGALAQNSAKPNQPEPALEGPKVKDNGIPNQTRRFAAGQNGDKKGAAAERGTPQRLFMRAIDALRGDKAPEGARLTEEQEAGIKKINEEFQDSQREFFASHKEEIQKTLASLPENERRRIMAQFQGLGPELKGRAIDRIADNKPAKKDAKKDAKSDAKEAPKPEPAEEMMPADGADAKAKEAQAAAGREKLKALYEAMPQPKDVQTKIFGLLTDPQKRVLQAELEKTRKEMEARAKGDAKGNDALSAMAAKDKITDEELAKSDLPDRLKERLKNLSPEQRPQAIKNLRDQQRPAEPAAPGAKKDKITDEDLAKLDIPDRAKERLKGLPPEERPAALEKLRQRLKNEGQGKRPGAGGGQDKPAPSSKDVNVPAPR